MEMCDLCLRNKERTRHINLYVWGSEGLCLCHECEMKLVNICTEMARSSLHRRETEHDALCHRAVKEIR